MSTRDPITYTPVDLPERSTVTDSQSLGEARGFYDRMKRRHSVRDFSDRPVDRDVIAECIRAAGTAPSGANHQPWHFVAVSDPAMKKRIRRAAETEERRFYQGGAGDEWIKALEPIGTTAQKPHLEEAPWLIVVFAQRWGTRDDGTRFKHYYVPESTGIACGFLVSALHHAGLVMLTHTPNPMRFLSGMLGRPDAEKPIMIIAVGHAAQDAKVPAVAKIKKPLEEILSFAE